MMFATMCPILVTGAWAERMEFAAFLCFTVAWPLLVYYPVAHWVWNTEGWMAKMGVIGENNNYKGELNSPFCIGKD